LGRRPRFAYVVEQILSGKERGGPGLPIEGPGGVEAQAKKRSEKGRFKKARRAGETNWSRMGSEKACRPFDR